MSTDGPTQPPVKTLTIRCHCSAVKVSFPYPRAALNECLCTLCHRYGAQWAYFPAKEVTVTGETDTYSWGPKENDFHRCRVCGGVTHWTMTDPQREQEVGVNCRLLDRDVLAGLEVRQEEGPE